MNLEAIWHDLECGAYAEDLPLWRTLAADAAGPVLDVGAGTGRVSLDLARRGTEVLALDINLPLLDALAVRAAGLPVTTLHADARDFTLDRPVALIVVPMQTLQLLGGSAGRAAFLRCAGAALEPGGRVAAALADATDSFDDDHPLPPPPQERIILGVRYASQLLAVTADAAGAAALHRRRTIGDESTETVIHLDRISPHQVEAEARALGFEVEPQLSVPETQAYLGSTVVTLRAP